VLRVLETLAAGNGPLGISDITRALDLDKATVFRILAALGRCGYVRQDAQTRRYEPDVGLLSLAARVLCGMDLPRRARPYLAELVARTGQSAHLAVLARGDPSRVVYVGHERSASRVQVDISIGHVAPSHCTAVGKALLAYLSPSQVLAVFSARTLARLTPKTCVSPAALRRQLRLVRRQGFAVDDEEFHRNVRCIAAPVRGASGEVVASLGISGISVEISREAIPHLARVVTDVAGRLSRELGPAAGAGLPGALAAGGVS
jgi:DNA-binding IclR family transcriptional regulator